MKGLRISILQDKCGSNCSNNGISARCNDVTLVAYHKTDGTFIAAPAIFEVAADAPAVVIVERELSGGIYLTAYELDKVLKHEHGMSGGCFIYSSDSRFRAWATYPVPLHDRFE